MNPVDNISKWLDFALQNALGLGMNLLAAAAIAVIGWWLAKVCARVVRRLLLRNQGVEPMLANLAARILYYIILACVLIAALGRLGIQTTSVIAVLGAAGLAVGLALQGSLSNFAAGILMALFRPFVAGDFIEGGGAMGTVQEITLFTTVLHTPDNKRVIVPNGKLYADNIVNFNALGQRRVDLVFGVSYSTDINKAKAVFAEELCKDSRILESPAPTIGLLELADSSINFAVRPWVHADHYWPVFYELQESIKQRLDAEGIAIPFPQQDVHIVRE